MGNFHTDVLLKVKGGGDPKKVFNDLKLLEPGTLAAVMGILADAKAAGLDIKPLETFRSQTRQEFLFKKGATKLRKVGTHGYGLACDFGVFVNGKYQGSARAYQILVALCMKHGLISGIDWGEPNRSNRFVDAGHVQRIPVSRQSELFAGRWYPPENYNPRGK